MDFSKKIQLTKEIFNNLGYFEEPKLLGNSDEQYNYRNKTIHSFDGTICDSKLLDFRHIEIINFIQSCTWISGFTIKDIFIKHNYLNQFQICFTINYDYNNIENISIIEEQLEKIIESLGKFQIVSVYYIKYSKDKNIKNNDYYYLLGNRKLKEKINILGNNYIIELSPYTFSRINYLNSILIYSIIKSETDKWKDNILLYGRDIYFPLKICNNVIGCITHCPITFNDCKDYFGCNNNIVKVEKNNYCLGISKLINSYDNILMNITAGRKGLGDKICKYLNNEPKIKKIIYISCNRDSLEKDFKILLKEFSIIDYYISNEFSHTNYNNIICIISK